MRRLLVLVVLLLPLVAGCSNTSFVGQRVDNFRAYYNKFYNARAAFDEEMRKLEDRGVDVDPTRYLPVFPVPEEGGNRQLEATIKKSADVLRRHPTSRWVDDALLLIGKSYFYQNNFVGAEQKFREVIDLGTKLEDEARFWLARSLVAAGAYGEADDHIAESLVEEDELSGRWAARLHLVRGELAVRQGRWEEAVEAMEAGLGDVRDDDLAARAYFTLGQVYETLGRYQEAADAFRGVERRRPVFELSYAALLSRVRVEGLYGDADEALALLGRLERDDKYYEDRAELAHLRGRIYARQGRAGDAFATFDDLLYTSDADISGVRGQTHYALGELLRDQYGDYLAAAAHFDTAATALRTHQQEGVRYTPAAITDSREVADMFAGYAGVMGRIQEADSLLRLGRLDDEAFDAFVMDMRRQKADELEAERERQERAQSQRRFDDARNTARQNLPERRGGAVAADGAVGESGFLYHRSAPQVRQGQRGFVERWGPRPHVPDWRRMQAVSAAVEEREPGEEAEEPLALLDEADLALPEIDVSAVPRDEEALYRMQRERAQAYYDLANVFFIQMSRPDSAAVWYRRVIDEVPEEPVGRRALYALAEVQRALGDSSTAQRLQHEVMTRFPDSELALRLREQTRDSSAVAQPSTDTLALAEAAYADAYARWQEDHEHDAALERMIVLADRYAGTEVAPRALLAAGSIALERARRDSLDVLVPLDLALPDTLLLRLGLAQRAAPLAGMADTDSLGATAAADSLGAAPADTAVLAASAASDTTGVPLVAVDSLGAASAGPEVPLANTVVADTAAVVPPAPARFFAVLTTRYPDAPQAERAGLILEALRQHEAAEQARVDSIAAARRAAADSLAALSPAAPPDTSLAVPRDSIGTPPAAVPDSTAAAGPPPPPVPAERPAEADTTAVLRPADEPPPRPPMRPDTTAADSMQAHLRPERR